MILGKCYVSVVQIWAGNPGAMDHMGQGNPGAMDHDPPTHSHPPPQARAKRAETKRVICILVYVPISNICFSFVLAREDRLSEQTHLLSNGSLVRAAFHSVSSSAKHKSDVNGSGLSSTNMQGGGPSDDWHTRWRLSMDEAQQ